MSTSVHVLAASLGDDQLDKLVSDLASSLLTRPQNLEILGEILTESHFKLDLDSHAAASIWLFIDAVYASEDESCTGSAIELVKVVPGFQSRMVEKIERDLGGYLATCKSQFLSHITSQNDLDSADFSFTGDSILPCLSFLEKLLIFCRDLPRESPHLDKLLYSYLASTDDSVLSAVTKCLRWRVDAICEQCSFENLWETIFVVAANGLCDQLTAALTMWIRSVQYITAAEDNKLLAQEYQALLAGTQYWTLLQLGLSSLLPEHRRIALSILQLSVRLITTSFSNNIMLWDSSSASKYLDEWQRFVTLYEVMAIDTSLHQAQAGSGAIVDLISPGSRVHPSWGFCLLSTGFKATMDSVRKFALGLTLSLPAANMRLLKFGPQFLSQTFLPYAMLATHFVVRSDNGAETCAYGARFSGFVSSMLKSFDCEKDVEQVASIILQTLRAQKDAFGPAKIYLAYGLLQGLDKPCLSHENSKSALSELFECSCEGDVFEVTSQTIFLRLLLKVKLVSLGEFISILDKFIKFNGWRVLNCEMPHIVTYLRDEKLTETDFLKVLESDKYTVEESALAFSIADTYSDGEWPQLEIFLAKQNDSFLSTLLASNLKIPSWVTEPEISKLFEGMVRRAQTKREPLLVAQLSLAASERLAVLASPSLQELLFQGLESQMVSEAHSTLSELVSTFSFFNKIVQGHFWPSFITARRLFDFKKNMFANSQAATKQDTSFYKLCDSAEACFLELVSFFVEKNEVPDSDLMELLQAVHGSASFERNVSLCALANAIMKKTSNESILEMVSEKLAIVWNELDSSRLQLNQKALQVAVIDTLFSAQILAAAVSNKTVAQHVHLVASSVISNAHGRRTILPVLTQKLSEFKIYSPKEFEDLPFVFDVLVRAFIVVQVRYNVFKLETVVGDFYDANFGSDGKGLYFQTYGASEVSSRVNVISILCSQLSERFCAQIVDYIFDHEGTLHLTQPLKTADSDEEWTRIRLLTIMVAVARHTLPQKHVRVLFSMLGTEPSPLVRIYLEWILALGVTDHTSIFLGFSSIADSAGNMPVLFTAYERIAFLLSQKLDTEKQSKIITDLLPHVVIGATSNKALIRHFSLSLVCSIHLEIMEKKLTVPKELLKLVEAMYHSATRSEAYGKHRNGDALLWDIQGDITLVGLLGGVLLKVSDRQVDSLSEKIIRQSLTSHQLLLLVVPVGRDQQHLWIAQRKHQDSKRELQLSSILEFEGLSPLQTKSGAWNGTVDLKEDKAVQRSELIVVSSLVDKPPNLGGICRLCDVLGAGLMTLHDIRAKNSPQFKNVAVTADVWMPMKEVAVDQIKNFMIEMKTQGYTLVGLEQTDKSVELNSSLKFPQKTLVLLGREKEGIPGDLLAELDFCVEIKQVGVIRSMNIQTATAVIVHAYSSQHC